MGKSTEGSRTGVSRRQFITRVGAGMAVGAVGLPFLLEACGSAQPAASSAAPASSAPASSAAASAAASTSTGASASAAASASGGLATSGTFGGVKLPTYVPFQGPKPDLPGNDQGLDPAYFKFPSQLVKSVPTPPGDGSTVSAITYLTLAAPPAMDKNAVWQAINKSLNVTLNLNMVPVVDYATRLSTLLAGNDLPDIIYNPTATGNVFGAIAGLPAFLASRCEYLTSYLSGDAIKDYPNLAHMTPYNWKSVSAVPGKMYAIPAARAPFNVEWMYQPDLTEKFGVKIDKAPKDADDFKKMLVACTDAKNNVWGVSGSPQFGLASNSPLLAMFNVPNNWKLDSSGKLVKDFETEEYKAAVAWNAEVFKAGAWHPDTLTMGANGNYNLAAGKFAFAPGIWGQYVQLWDLVANTRQGGKIYPMHPFSADGKSKPIYHAGQGNFGWSVIRKQSSPAKVKMLLKIADFFAAPFGTEEWLLNYYGVKGVDYTVDENGSPHTTKQGQSELTATWRYISSPPYALFDPIRSQEFAQVSYDAEKAFLENPVFDPTLGLYSQTGFSAGIPAQTAFYNAVNDIVQGRRPITDMGNIVADWRSKAGDKMRTELQAELEKVK